MIHQLQTATLRLDVTTMDMYLLLTPLFALGAFALVRFIGCNWVFGLDETILAIDPPESVVATAGDESVALTWFYPTGKAISFEVIYGTEAGGPYPNTRSVMPAATGVEHGVNIGSLVNGQPYFFRVGGTGHDSVVEQSAEVSATPGVTEFINPAAIALGGPRNDFAGFVGMAIRPSESIVVTQLGRIVGPGNNTGSHVVKIVHAVNNPVPGGPGSGQDLGAVTITPPSTGLERLSTHLCHRRCRWRPDCSITSSVERKTRATNGTTPRLCLHQRPLASPSSNMPCSVRATRPCMKRATTARPTCR